MRRYSGALALCILVAMLTFGLVRIFRIRFTSGAIYPQWSSLRADPDGTRLLFDSLTGTGHLRPTRNYKDIAEVHEHNATLLLIGMQPASLIGASAKELGVFEKLATNGNRVVIALDADGGFPNTSKTAEALEKRWGVVAVKGSFRKSDGWITDTSIDDKKPVIIERAFGSGVIVLAANADDLSNETLAEAEPKDSAALLKLIGPNPRIIFDESHLGVEESGSTLGLIHRYHLDGALWGLLLLSIVFVWGNALGFPPPDPARSDIATAHDSRAGLAQLLRRQIPASQITATCLREWQRFHPRANLLRAPDRNDPVDAYRELQKEFTAHER